MNPDDVLNDVLDAFAEIKRQTQESDKRELMVLKALCAMMVWDLMSDQTTKEQKLEICERIQNAVKGMEAYAGQKTV